MNKQYFTFAEIRDSLADMHDITSEKRSAFANRIKNLQRKGFPGGVNTGRGTTANYLWEHLIRLGFVFEVLEIGIIPDKAIEFIEIQNDDLFTAIKSLVLTDGVERTFFVTSLGGLEDLRGHLLLETISQIVGESELPMLFAEPANRPKAVIDLHELVVRLYKSLEKVTSLPKETLADSFKAWAESL